MLKSLQESLGELVFGVIIIVGVGLAYSCHTKHKYKLSDNERVVNINGKTHIVVIDEAGNPSFKENPKP